MDDDLAPPDALAHIEAPFSADPALALSYGAMTSFSGSGADVRKAPVSSPQDARPFFTRLMETCCVAGHPCVLVKRTALSSIRRLDQTICASVDCYLHLDVAMQGDVAAVPETVLRQRQNAGLRGPQSNRYSAHRAAKWMQSDRYIFTRLLDRPPLVAFLDRPLWTELPPVRPPRRLTKARSTPWQRRTAHAEGCLASPDGFHLCREQRQTTGRRPPERQQRRSPANAPRHLGSPKRLALMFGQMQEIERPPLRNHPAGRAGCGSTAQQTRLS